MNEFTSECGFGVALLRERFLVGFAQGAAFTEFWWKGLVHPLDVG